MAALATTGWDIVTAIGTLSAALVALGIAVAPAVARRLRRPRIEFAVGEVEPYCVAAPSEMSTVGAVHLRVAIKNVGRSDLELAWTTVTRRWSRDLPIPHDWPPGLSQPYVRDAWVVASEEPVNVRWSTGLTETTTIAVCQVGYIELAVLDVKKSALTISAVRSEDVVGGVEVPQPNSRHRWEFVVGGHGINVQGRVIEFAIDGRNFIGEVSLTDAPSNPEEGRILGLLGRLSEEVRSSAEEPGAVDGSDATLHDLAVAGTPSSFDSSATLGRTRLSL